MANKTINGYNLTQIGVDVDTDNLHVPVGAFRQAQNISPTAADAQNESIITREGLRNLNQNALGVGAILGGCVIPLYETGDGVPTMFLGFGD